MRNLLKRLVLTVTALICPTLAFAQGIPISGIAVTGPSGQPRPGATLSFCAHPANAVPCTNYVNVYADIGLTILINQAASPIKTDGLGNAPILYTNPGIIDYTVSGTGVLTPNGPYVIAIPLVAGGAGTPGGIPGQGQFNNSGFFGGSPCINLTAFPTGPLNLDCNTASKGPNPGFDVTRYGARFFPSLATTTATCTNASTAVTLAAAFDFINGDGIVLQQCGAATSLSTPAAPSTVVQRAVANGVTTRSYKVVAEDFSLGLTAASPATSIANAAATLGAINTATTSSFTASGPVITYTTAGNHNLAVGALIQFGSNNGVYQVTATPSGTTFSIPNLGAGDQIGTVQSVSVTVASHIQVFWTGQANVMRYWVYRQDGGAGNFNLVGVAQGQEPFFDDYGYAAPTAPAYVPATAPASATRQSVATTIVSGAGTTSIVVANAASNSIGGVQALHDSTVAFAAACSAAIAAGGGRVYIPSSTVAGSALLFSFPMKFPAFAGGDIYIEMGGPINAAQPIINNIAGSRYFFVGTRGTTGGAYPSFGRSYYSHIAGNAYPLVLVTNQATASIRFDDIYFDALAPQQWAVLVDNQFAGGGPVTIDFYNNFFGAQQSGSGLVLRGVGFGYTLFNNGYSVNNANFYSLGSLRLMGSATAVPTQLPGIGQLTLGTFLGAGIHADQDALNGAMMAGVGSPWNFNLMFSEAMATPLLDARNINSTNWYNWSFTNFQYADAATNAMAIDMTNSTGLIGFTVSGMAGGTTPFSGNLSAVQGLTYIQDSPFDSVLLPPNYAITRLRVTDIGAGFSSTPLMTFETDNGLRLKGIAPVFAELAAPTNLAGAVAAGGLVPVGTWTYRVIAVGWNNGESLPSNITGPLVVTGGNQTVNLTWAASGAGTQGYNVYRSNNGLGTGHIRVNNSLITTNSYSDIIAAANGTAIPTASGTGSSYLNATEVSAPQFRMASAVTWASGAGVPSGGSCTAATGGSLYSRTDGGTTTTLYVCDNSTHVWTPK